MNKDKVDQFIEFMLHFQRFGEQSPPFEKLGISPAQIVYLDYLARYAPCTLTQITEGLGLRAASVSVMIKVLESKGLISRKKNAEDGRSILLDLTNEGRQAFTGIDRYRRQKAERLLSRLTEAEMDQLLSVFEKTMQI